MSWIIDAVLVVLLLLIAWCVYGEGIWGAALRYIEFMIGGLVAFCFYEPVANLIASNLGFMASFADIVSVSVLFCIVFSALRFATDTLSPTMVRFPAIVDQIGRVVFSLLLAWYMTGMSLCMLQMAPVHKQFLGYQWQNHALRSTGIDRYWLGYVQWTTEKVFDWNPPRPFDPRSDFIKRYHDHRPLGEPDPSLQ
jgi:uncharacterized membrane protein required for colicin V production